MSIFEKLLTGIEKTTELFTNLSLKGEEKTQKLSSEIKGLLIKARGEKEIVVPEYYQVVPPSLSYSESIETKDQNGYRNGSVYPLVNVAIPSTPPVELVYLTTCIAGSIKGPHVHLPPKIDRFTCVFGECLVVTRNERTKTIRSFLLSANKPAVVTIPPYNSHAIVSENGCTILSICTERYYPNHYNQIEVDYGSQFSWELVLREREVNDS